MATLRATRGFDPGRVFPLKSGAMSLGRHPTACDVVLDHFAVSREHARLETIDKVVYIEDLHSRNGVFVNGKIIRPGAEGRQRLNSGDRIEIVAFEFVFDDESGSALEGKLIDATTIDSLINLLSTQHVNFRGPNWHQLQEELSVVESALRKKLSEAFGRVVVLDVNDGFAADGRFDMDMLLRAMWKKIATAFGLHYDEAAFHPEQISQSLKSEEPALFCLLNVQPLTEEHLHLLRGLGFTQENHHVLYVGSNPNLGTIVATLGEHASNTLAIDTGSSIHFSDISELQTVDGDRRLSADTDAKLKAMMEITQHLGTAKSLDNVLEQILESLFRIFIHADRGCIVLIDDNGVLVPKCTKQRREGSDDTIRVSRTIARQVMDTKKPILSTDAASDQRFEMSQSIADFRIRSMMCAPLIDTAGRAIGILQIDTLDQRQRFREDDSELLMTVATQASLAIENARLWEARLRDQQRDLELAGMVQRGFLPKRPATIPGYETCDFYESADQVGGDFLSYVQLDDQRVVLAVGDVAGHGMAAALFMARLYPMVQYQCQTQTSLPLAMVAINQDICEAGGDQRFVTLLLAEVNSQSHTLTVVNAGHLPPLIFRHGSGTVEAIGDSPVGLPAGVMKDADYEAITTDIGPQDRALLYTDGIIELMNATNEVYGISRLRERFGESTAGLSETIRALVADAHAFAGASKLQDDFCLIACQRIR